MEVLINGEKIKNIKDFHLRMKEAFELPDYYGENLDALWDCLTGWIVLPVKVVWIDFEKSKENLGDFANRAIQVFRDAEEEIDGFSLECYA